MKKIFLLLVASLMWVISMAQVLFVKDVNVVVSSGAVLKTIDLKTAGNATLFING